MNIENEKDDGRSHILKDNMCKPKPETNKLLTVENDPNEKLAQSLSRS